MAMQVASALKHLWSFPRNARQLVHRPEDRATPLDGLRVIAITWVIALHAYQNMPFVSGTTPAAVAALASIDHVFGYRVVSNGSYGVDMFFVISGYLIMTILRKDLASTHSARAKLANVGRFLVRRLLRIAPAYMTALGVWYAVVSSQTDAVAQAQAAMCVADWWQNVLYINNFFPMTTRCMVWSWSIAVEMQLYLLSPPIVWAVVRFPRMASWILVSIALASMIAYMVVTSQIYQTMSIELSDAWVDVVYTKPYMRLHAYALGMLAAHRVHVEASAPSAPPAASSAVAARVLALMLAVLPSFFLVDPRINNSFVDGGYFQIVFGRPVFCIAIAYLAYDVLAPAHAGSLYVRAVTAVLGSRLAYTLAQLSYTIYLVHLLVLYVVYVLLFAPLVQTGQMAFDPAIILVATVALVFSGSTVLAIVMYFIVEKPFINISTDYVRTSGSQKLVHQLSKDAIDLLQHDRTTIDIKMLPRSNETV